MGRELRRVPPNWEHPKSVRLDYRTGAEKECYRPMYDRPYIDAITEWIAEHERWECGYHPALKAEPALAETFPHYADYGGNPPSVEDYRPAWTPEEATWWQVYETVSEGTPVTPPVATREELVDYLVENGDFWDQKRREEGGSSMPCGTWSRKQADAFVFRDGWAPSFIVDCGRVMSGVEAIE